MFTEKEMQLTVRERFEDAKALLSCARAQGAVYMCGYAIEIKLKAAICTKELLSGFPEKAHEFDGSMRKYRTHDLEKLVMMAGKETAVKTTSLGDWSIILQWDPESRYATVHPSIPDAAAFIESAERLLAIL